MPHRSEPESISVRILVCDDFEPARRSICSILSGQEQLHVIGEAADGLEAVQKAEEMKPDLILLDIGLPRLNGLEAARRIEQVAPHAKILLVSQINDVEVIRAALRNGVGGFVVKADVQRELLLAIKAVLRGEQFVSSRLKGQGPGSR